MKKEMKVEKESKVWNCFCGLKRTCPDK